MKKIDFLLKRARTLRKQRENNMPSAVDAGVSPKDSVVGSTPTEGTNQDNVQNKKTS